MAIGKRIYLKRNMPDKAIMREFEELPAANVADVMNRSSGMNPRIHLMSSPQKTCTVGAALTIKNVAGDNLVIHAALDMAQPGDFLIVSNEEGSARSLIGAVMLNYLMCEKRAAGIIVDGPTRDIDEAAEMEMPIYATGTTPGGPYKFGPGEINVPISCGGIHVNPGDIIMADHDGIVVIPPKDASRILEDAKKFHAADEAKLAAVKNGTMNRSWVARTLQEQQFEFIDGIYQN